MNRRDDAQREYRTRDNARHQVRRDETERKANKIVVRSERVELPKRAS
jgi:hypothetical protein